MPDPPPESEPAIVRTLFIVTRPVPVVPCCTAARVSRRLYIELDFSPSVASIRTPARDLRPPSTTLGLQRASNDRGDVGKIPPGAFLEVILHQNLIISQGLDVSREHQANMELPRHKRNCQE